MVLTLADMDGQETFEASALGTAAEVLPCSICCVPACFAHITSPISGGGGGGHLAVVHRFCRSGCCYSFEIPYGPTRHS